MHKTPLNLIQAFSVSSKHANYIHATSIQKLIVNIEIEIKSTVHASYIYIHTYTSL